MRKYKAGDLRHAVVLLEPVVTMINNRRETTWIEHEIMAGKRDVGGKQFYVAAAYHTEDTVTYLIRYRTDITAGWRLRDHGVTYDVLPPNHLDYMGDFMELRCRAVAGSGV